jgi:serine/threonine protein kinase/HEAT repeat protein
VRCFPPNGNIYIEGCIDNGAESIRGSNEGVLLMAVQRGAHPSADILKAFGLGKLDDGSSGVVLDHLDQCEDCRQQVASLSGDDFLNRLRQARGQSSTPAPAKALSDVSRAAKPPVRQPAIANLPPELAANQQYEILRELGRGGMGVVYLAKNKLMDRLEVLKVVNKALLDHPGAVERFLREIRSAAKLSHANVVAAYHALQDGELLAFAMEYVEGQDLASLVKSQGPLPIVHACYYVQQAALGLQHAFEKGMVHRDIKPQNLILAREGKKHIVKVLDFGLAKATREKTDDTGLTGEGKMLGTPDYIAPEQTLDAARADIRADIYSLGCTLYYLLSGRPPFSANNLAAMALAHQTHEAKPLNLVRPQVPEELAAVVRKMMAKSPTKRYQAPLDVVQALAPFVKQGATPKASPELSSGTVEAKPAVEPQTSPERQRRAEDPGAGTPGLSPEPKPQPESADVWGALTADSAASVGPPKTAIVRKPRAATVRERSSRQNWLLGGGIGVAVLLLTLLGMWAGGVFKVKTPEGTIVLENLPADAEVLVDEAKVIVKWDKGGKTAQIRVPQGRHKIEVIKDGIKVIGEVVEIEDGKRRILTAKLAQQPIAPYGGLIDANPYLFIRFHDYPGDKYVPKPSMRFGLQAKDPKHPDQPKYLTFDEHGLSNNTVLLVDGRQYLFGETPLKGFGFDQSDPPGEWVEMKAKLQGEIAGRPRDGLASSWLLPGRKLKITQEVEIMPGQQSRRLDTCLVRYILKNQDTRPHEVGIRFLLDTFIGSKDAVPFAVPGVSELCDTKLMFDTPEGVPNFIQALEKDDLRNPGTAAFLQFRVGKNIESPSRVQLGRWPEPQLQQIGIQAAKAQYTGWNVPFVSMKERAGNLMDDDSAVTMYWNEQTLEPRKTRVVGFAYGLGHVDTRESGGHLLLTAGGRLVPNVDFSLMALVHNPNPDETLTLELPAGIEAAGQQMTRMVPAVPPGARRQDSPVTWRLRASKDGKHELTVRSSTGVKQRLPLTIPSRGMFDKGGEQAPPAPPAPVQPKVNLPDDASVDDLRKALKHEDPDVREIAAARLANLGPKAKPAMYALAEALTSAKTPTSVRRNAALAIAHIGAEAKPIAAALAHVLDTSEPLEVRQFAAEGLAQMKYPANEAALSAILKAIEKDIDPLVRQRCVWALFKLNDLKPSGADKILAKVLDETGAEKILLRCDIARKLANTLHDEAPDKTVDVLLEMLTSKSLTFVTYNSTDLKEERGRTKPQANKGGDARYMAAMALGWLGKKARDRKDVIDALKAAAKDADPQLSQSATDALRELGVP